MSRTTLYVKVKEDGTLESEFVIAEPNIQTNSIYDEETFVLPSGYEVFVEPSKPSNMTKYQIVIPSPIEKVNGVWTRTLTVADVDDFKKSYIDGAQASMHRQLRDDALTRCDWTQLPDCQLSTQKKTEWTTYRQQLRDLTGLIGWPVHYEWPQRPTK